VGLALPRLLAARPHHRLAVVAAAVLTDQIDAGAAGLGAEVGVVVDQQAALAAEEAQLEA
jgi:hypothetical protein